MSNGSMAKQKGQDEEIGQDVIGRPRSESRSRLGAAFFNDRHRQARRSFRPRKHNGGRNQNRNSAASHRSHGVGNRQAPCRALRTRDAVSAFHGKPDRASRTARLCCVALVGVVGWILTNLAMMAMGSKTFAWLEGVVSLAALYMTVLILSTQRRDDELATHREQLTPELAILGVPNFEIAWITMQLRCHNLQTHKRVFEAIKDSHEEVLKQR